MKKSELRNIIRESIKQTLNEQGGTGCQAGIPLSLNPGHCLYMVILKHCTITSGPIGNDPYICFTSPTILQMSTAPVKGDIVQYQNNPSATYFVANVRANYSHTAGVVTDASGMVINPQNYPFTQAYLAGSTPDVATITNNASVNCPVCCDSNFWNCTTGIFASGQVGNPGGYCHNACTPTPPTGCSAWSGYNAWLTNFTNTVNNLNPNNPNQPCQFLCQKETQFTNQIPTVGPVWANQLQCKLDEVQLLMQTHNCASSSAPAC